MLEEILNYYYPKQTYNNYKKKIKNIGKKKLSYSKVIQLIKDNSTFDKFLESL